MTLLAKRLNGTASVPRSLLDEVFGFSQLGNFGSDVEITNAADGFLVEIPVPGFQQGEIDVTLDRNVISVAAKNDRRKLTRSLLIPEEIDSENIEIVAEHGMLTIHLKTNPKAMPKKLDVRYNE
jgi:HSP20 family molecular chaperone IbpA